MGINCCTHEKEAPEITINNPEKNIGAKKNNFDNDKENNLVVVNPSQYYSSNINSTAVSYPYYGQNVQNIVNESVDLNNLFNTNNSSLNEKEIQAIFDQAIINTGVNGPQLNSINYGQNISSNNQIYQNINNVNNQAFQQNQQQLLMNQNQFLPQFQQRQILNQPLPQFQQKQIINQTLPQFQQGQIINQALQQIQQGKILNQSPAKQKKVINQSSPQFYQKQAINQSSPQFQQKKEVNNFESQQKLVNQSPNKQKNSGNNPLSKSKKKQLANHFLQKLKQKKAANQLLPKNQQNQKQIIYQPLSQNQINQNISQEAAQLGRGLNLDELLKKKENETQQQLDNVINNFQSPTNNIGNFINQQPQNNNANIEIINQQQMNNLNYNGLINNQQLQNQPQGENLKLNALFKEGNNQFDNKVFDKLYSQQSQEAQIANSQSHFNRNINPLYFSQQMKPVSINENKNNYFSSSNSPNRVMQRIQAGNINQVNIPQ